MGTKIRKIKRYSHKRFGTESRIVDGVWVKPIDAGGRSVGSKQIHPDSYKRRNHDHGCDFRSRAEKRNADDMRLDVLD
jgi:hypothetical protein